MNSFNGRRSFRMRWILYLVFAFSSLEDNLCIIYNYRTFYMDAYSQSIKADLTRDYRIIANYVILSWVAYYGLRQGYIWFWIQSFFFFFLWVINIQGRRTWSFPLFNQITGGFMLSCHFQGYLRKSECRETWK